MRRPLSRLLVLVVFLAAALIPGAAVFVPGVKAFSCAAEPPPLTARIQDSPVIVLGAIEDVGGSLQLRPEAFLKGPARLEPLLLLRPGQQPECPLAKLSAGDRVMLFLAPSGTGFAWPDAAYAFVLEDGHARLTGDVADDRAEAQLVAEVRAVTNLYAVPAKDTSEAEGIDWMKTVLPVAGALALVFGIGLLFMRTWHRIDPT